MQVFIVGTPFETAEALDVRRINKQIIENKQIMDAILGTGKGWFNHPVVKSYKNHFQWLYYYNLCLFWYNRGDKIMARKVSEQAMAFKPNFHTEEYFNQMKRRLYEKNEEYYKQWSYLGKSLDNWYFVDGEWVKYRNGKKIIE